MVLTAKRSVSRVPPLAALAAGLGLVTATVAYGGSAAAFLDLPALVIVLGGTLAVSAASFTPADLAAVPRSLAAALAAGDDGDDAAARLARASVALAEAARCHGLLALERRLPALDAWPVLRRGLGLAIDGLPPDRLARTLLPEVDALAAGHARSAEVLRRAADVAPAMGLIGTLAGLVQMLGSLDRPDAIGPAMAVALLTTLYGALLAHMVLLPLADRIAGLAGRETWTRGLEAELAEAIAAGENPHRLRDRLAGLLGDDGDGGAGRVTERPGPATRRLAGESTS